MNARETILARRARFIAASMAAISGACASGRSTPTSVPASASASASTSTATSASASTSTVLDTDGDSIPDDEDFCPTVAGSPSKKPHNGCPEVIVSVCLSIVILAVPHFSEGSAKLTPESQPILDETASILKAHPEIEELELAGHCDATEKPCPDLARANAVREALVKRGIDVKRLTPKASGRDAPITSNTTKEGRAKNRRVEFRIAKKQ